MTMSEPPVNVVRWVLRPATPADLAAVEWLDTFGASPHREIHRHMESYFGSVDPSLHERNLIILAEAPPAAHAALPFPVVGKAELLLAPADSPSEVGYIKRVVVHPDWRGQGVARALLAHLRTLAPGLGLRYLDLHVWDGNAPAVRLYESLGFAQRHRELYLRLDLDAAPAATEEDHQP